MWECSGAYMGAYLMVDPGTKVEDGGCACQEHGHETRNYYCSICGLPLVKLPERRVPVLWIDLSYDDEILHNELTRLGDEWNGPSPRYLFLVSNTPMQKCDYLDIRAVSAVDVLHIPEGLAQSMVSNFMENHGEAIRAIEAKAVSAKVLFGLVVW